MLFRSPVLYGDILLGREKSLLTQSLLLCTLRKTQPTHKTLVKTMTIVPTEDGSIANLLSICFIMPNLRKLILDFERFDLSTLNPNVVQQLRSLSMPCTIQIGEDGHFVDIGGWGSLPSYIDFTRCSKLTSRGFRLFSSDSR